MSSCSRVTRSRSRGAQEDAERLLSIAEPLSQTSHKWQDREMMHKHETKDSSQSGRTGYILHTYIHTYTLVAAGTYPTSYTGRSLSPRLDSQALDTLAAL